eukprot:1394493-Amorphochlora_amoeboformis.AAC.1
MCILVCAANPMWFGNKSNEPNNPAWTNRNWLKSRFHFSFAEYYNSSNTNFGVLRVMNDDLVQPKRGFGSHPHSNAEIVTYVVEGKLTHQDSMGTKESLGRGSIQFMTAGSGVVHSEHNLEDKPLRFIQMWFTPDRRGLSPNYGSMSGTQVDSKDKWGHLVSSADSKIKTPVKIRCDANIFIAQITEEKTRLQLEVKENRQVYFLAIEGNPTVSLSSGQKQKFGQHDAAELYGEEIYTVQGLGHVLVVEMKNDRSGGRGDL